MQFGYTIIYVPDVAASLAFFTRAFGLARRFLHESGTYGELDVHFISSLPVILWSACKAWVDKESVQIVAAED